MLLVETKLFKRKQFMDFPCSGFVPYSGRTISANPDLKFCLKLVTSHGEWDLTRILSTESGSLHTRRLSNFARFLPFDLAFTWSGNPFLLHRRMNK